MKENFSIPTQFFSVVLLVITALVTLAGEGTPYLFPRYFLYFDCDNYLDLVANFKKGKHLPRLRL